MRVTERYLTALPLYISLLTWQWTHMTVSWEYMHKKHANQRKYMTISTVNEYKGFLFKYNSLFDHHSCVKRLSIVLCEVTFFLVLSQPTYALLVKEYRASNDNTFNSLSIKDKRLISYEKSFVRKSTYIIILLSFIGYE